MTTIIIAGMTGQGKSPFIKNYIKGRSCLIFDVRNEYGERTKYPGQEALNLPIDNSKPRSRYIGGDVKQFTAIAEKKANTIIVFEEATIFFEGKTNEDTRRIMLNKMFTNNIYIFVFHSISAIPPRIMQLSDYVVLFKTNDEPYQVENKYPSLFDSYSKLKGKDNGSKLIIKLNS